jgi:hypothetical protein
VVPRSEAPAPAGTAGSAGSVFLCPVDDECDEGPFDTLEEFRSHMSEEHGIDGPSA